MARVPVPQHLSEFFMGKCFSRRSRTFKSLDITPPPYKAIVPLEHKGPAQKQQCPEACCSWNVPQAFSFTLPNGNVVCTNAGGRREFYPCIHKLWTDIVEMYGDVDAVHFKSNDIVAKHMRGCPVTDLLNNPHQRNNWVISLPDS